MVKVRFKCGITTIVKVGLCLGLELRFGLLLGLSLVLVLGLWLGYS
jgi:hypothetical protein